MTTATDKRMDLFTEAELWTLIDALDALDDQSSWGDHGEALHRELTAEAKRREEAS